MKRFSKTQTCLFVHWTRPTCRYLLATHGTAGTPQVLAVGSCDVDKDESIAGQLREKLTEEKTRFQQAVVLLPRSDLDMIDLTLPPASEEELPTLVQHAVLQQLEDTGQGRAIDFVPIRQGEDDCEALAFSCNQRLLDELRVELKEHSAGLTAVTYSGFGAVEILKHVSKHPAPTALVVTTSDHDIDLAVEANGEPILFRTIPRSLDSEPMIGQRLCDEIRRTLALAHRGEDESTRLYLIGDVVEQEPIARTLSEQLSLAVSVINPVDQVDKSEKLPQIESPARYANLIGAAFAWQRNQFELDLLHPRQAPAPSNPWKRLGFWAALAASLLILAVSFVRQQQAVQAAELDAEKAKLKKIDKRAQKATELQGIVAAVNQWRADDIVWLDELQDLSTSLPSYDQTLIRRMSMSTSGDRRGVIDLAVQVRSPEIVSALEDAVRDERRSVSSKRVAETDQSTELSWQFETRIIFEPQRSDLARSELDGQSETESQSKPAVDESFVEEPAANTEDVE